jgi:hypothetical protein
LFRIAGEGTAKMLQHIDRIAPYEVPTRLEVPCDDGRGGLWSRSEDASRRRTRAATLVLGCLCSVVAFLAIDTVGDRDLLFEQYDFKLWSHHDRLAVFCLSVLPSFLGMVAIFVAYKAISGLRSIL